MDDLFTVQLHDFNFRISPCNAIKLFPCKSQKKLFVWVSKYFSFGSVWAINPHSSSSQSLALYRMEALSWKFKVTSVGRNSIFTWFSSFIKSSGSSPKLNEVYTFTTFYLLKVEIQLKSESNSKRRKILLIKSKNELKDMKRKFVVTNVQFFLSWTHARNDATW